VSGGRSTGTRVAITGGTGFVGGHLAAHLVRQGHQVVIIARGADRRPWARYIVGLPNTTLVQVGIGDVDGLAEAFAGCEAVAHCAGINRELDTQTYRAVHVDGTANVVRAAERVGVRRLALLSFLRARPDCGSGYHESKSAAEQIVRASGLEWTVLKPGMIYGRGDHMLEHLSRALHTFPVFVRLGSARVRPLAVDDVVRVLEAALVDGRLAHRTVPLVGPTELALDDAVELIARATGRRPRMLRVPAVERLLPLAAWLTERLMTTPALSIAQARILREEVIEPTLTPDRLPADLIPSTPFDIEHIRAGLPEPAPFDRTDLRCWKRLAHAGEG
jgi:NADH dehydrogenase